MGKYDEHEHENDPIYCPRQNCRRKNAPMESDDFSPRCWKCNAFLNVAPVEVGDELVVDVEDIHENGSGVGKTQTGYVVLVEGVLPPKKVRVVVDNVKPNYAIGEVIDEIDTEDDDTSEHMDDDEEDEPTLGSRDNYWG